ncbi:MAG: DUF1275 domain-containing protein [Verrucomicrobiaceae bacterium]|nr:DUF1275 domain-containing protein [Verrucomicrobiaceae bacterium]
MKIRKEYLIGAAACLLCLLSGAVNVHFVRLFTFSVGNLTGDTFRILIEFDPSQKDYHAAITLTLILLFFLAGAATAGATIHHPRFDLERPYGRSLMAIGGLFLLAALLEKDSAMAALSFAAFASGLQNGLATRYRGIILRTTHVTGIITDLGQSIGMKIAGNLVDKWKIGLHFFLFVSFFGGGILGMMIDTATGDKTAVVIGSIYLLFGTLFHWVKHYVFRWHDRE